MSERGFLCCSALEINNCASRAVDQIKKAEENITRQEIKEKCKLTCELTKSFLAKYYLIKAYFLYHSTYTEEQEKKYVDKSGSIEEMKTKMDHVLAASTKRRAMAGSFCEQLLILNTLAATSTSEFPVTMLRLLSSFHGSIGKVEIAAQKACSCITNMRQECNQAIDGNNAFCIEYSLTLLKHGVKFSCDDVLKSAMEKHVSAEDSLKEVETKMSNLRFKYTEYRESAESHCRTLTIEKPSVSVDGEFKSLYERITAVENGAQRALDFIRNTGGIMDRCNDAIDENDKCRSFIKMMGVAIMMNFPE